MIRSKRTSLSLLALSIALGGCSGSLLESKRIDYKSAKQIERPLEIPPDLTAPQRDDRFAVPDGPLEVVEGKGAIWEYVRPELEQAGPVEKHLLRLGPANARAVKEKARELRAALGLWEESATAWRQAIVSAPYLQQAAVYALAPTPGEAHEKLKARLRARTTGKTVHLPWEKARDSFEFFAIGYVLFFLFRGVIARAPGTIRANRGLLFHRYVIDADGTIQDAQIVPPTSQNQAGVEALVHSLTRGYQRERLVLVWGNMADKNLLPGLLALLPLSDRIIFTRAEPVRSASPEALLVQLPPEHQCRAECAATVAEAIDAASWFVSSVEPGSDLGIGKPSGA